MTEHMNYSTYGRPVRRPNRRVASDKHQVQKPSAAASQPRQGRGSDSKDKNMTNSSDSNRRRSDPDGAYCVSREEHSSKIEDAKSRDRSGSRGRQRVVAAAKEKSRPSSMAQSTAPPPRSKSATAMRQSRSTHRSPSPQLSRRSKAGSTKARSSSVRGSRPRGESFNDRRQRSSSLKSCRSTKSCKSTKSESPTLTSEISGFDLKSPNKIASNNKPRAKKFLMNQISRLSILGGCKKNHVKPPSRPRGVPTRKGGRSRKADTVASRSAPTARRYQLEDGSCTFMSDEDVSSSDSSSDQSESESEFNSEYDEIFSSSSDDESLQSLRESDEEEIFDVLQKSMASFVEDEFATDDEISGADDLNRSDDTPSVSARSKALLHTLEAENAALRASVVALRSDWEYIVNKMSRLQDGDDSSLPDEITEKSPNLDAIRDLRNQALESLNTKQTREITQRNKRESDLKSCIECVEELLCENERLYDNIMKLTQEREDILQELTSLRKQAETSLEESHRSGLLFTDEHIAKSHEEYIDDIASLLTKVKKDLSNKKNGDNVNIMGNEIMQLVSKIMSQRVDVDNSESHGDIKGDAKDPAANQTSVSFGSSALVIRRKSSRRSSHGSNISRSKLEDSGNTNSATRHGSSAYYCSSSTRRSSGYSDSSRCRTSVYSDSSRGESDTYYTSDSESEDDERYEASNDSKNSLFDGDAPSFSSTHDEDASCSDLEIIYEKLDSSDSECSSHYRTRSPMKCAKKKSWYNAVRSVASRIRKNDRRRDEKYPVYNDDDVARELSSSRSSGSTNLSDIELTYYPGNISRCSPSTNSRSSSRSSSKSARRSTSLHFSSIKEDDDMPVEDDRPKPSSETACQHSLFSPKQADDDVSIECDMSDRHEYNESGFSIGMPLPPREFSEQDTPSTQPSYATKSTSNTPGDINVKTRRTVSTCASVSNCDSEFDNGSLADNASHATSSSESTKERKGICITVVSRSSRFVTLPSSRSHTYMTIFTVSLLKNQVDKVLYEQYHESMREIIGSMSSVTTEITSGAKKKQKRKYQGDFNKEGERHGYGIYKSKNGNEYRGEWQHNKREGLGVVKIGNGDVFEGQFDNNMKNGIGVYHYIDGECDLSRYKDDQRIGNSVRYTDDRKRAFLLTEDLNSKEISIADAAVEARAMGVIIQL